MKSVSQNLRILGISSSAGLLLCAWKVKQLLNPSAFSYIYILKIQDSTEKHSIEMKTFQIYCHHSHKSSHFSPGPSNNVRQMSRKE